MTELAKYEQNGIVQQQDAMKNRAVARLGEWAHAAAAAYEVAQGLVDTSFVPAQFKGKPAEATAAILSGAEVGLSPMASLKSFDIIQGTAAPKALTLRAIVQSQGHEMILDESTENRCKMRGRRRGETEWTKVQWTLDRAKGLGLVNKDNWKKQPTAMLVARATGELARLIAADAILGIGYTVEEIADGADVTLELTETTETPPEPPKKRTMQRKPKKATETPTEEPELPVATVSEDGEPLMNDDQRAKMFAQFDELGIRDRSEYRAYIENVVGHPVQTSKVLTVAEASSVIESQIADLETKGVDA